jgi:primosomal protein N' (replication factor Y)
VLEAGEQAILFLNRRGSATYVFCRACGHTMKCPRCEIPLTYHTEPVGRQIPGQILLCHRCSYQRGMPKTCPECHSPQIRHYGTGTERVEEEVHKLLPQVRTLRWDYETTRQKGAHETILRSSAPAMRRQSAPR